MARTTPAITADRKGGSARRVEQAFRAPPFRPVQRATLVDTVPTGGRWLHDMKYDGYRTLLATGGGEARAYTRSGLDWSDRFAGLVVQAATLEVGSALCDGEEVTAALPKVQPKGRIFVDYLRNQRGATAVMPYSVRARSGAPVAAPISWHEMETIDTPAHWYVRTGEARRVESARRMGEGRSGPSRPAGLRP
jgi:bifunctional non-homologous end joining protein LigD